MTNLKLNDVTKPLVAALSLAVFASPILASSHGMMGSGGTDGTSMNGRPMLMMPMMDPARGRKLFAEKGCVVCHSINGIGGEDAPSLDISQMSGPMDAFDFAARMWRGAPAMIAMQQMELGAQIELTGEELADIIAFAHSPGEQAKFSEDDIPKEFSKILAGSGDD